MPRGSTVLRLPVITCVVELLRARRQDVADQTVYLDLALFDDAFERGTASEARVAEPLQGRKGAEVGVVREEKEGRGGILLEVVIAGGVWHAVGVKQSPLSEVVECRRRAGQAVRRASAVGAALALGKTAADPRAEISAVRCDVAVAHRVVAFVARRVGALSGVKPGRAPKRVNAG